MHELTLGPSVIGQSHSSQGHSDPGVSSHNLLERLYFEGVKGDFLMQGSDVGGTFCLLFLNLHKIWI